MAITFIIDIEHERLKVILGYLVSEAILTVFVYGSRGAYQSVDGSGILFRENIAGMLLYKPEKDWFEPHTGFYEHFLGKSEKGSGKIAAAAIDADNSSRKEHYLGVFYNFIIFQVNRDVCPSSAAEVNGAPFQFPQVVHDWR